MTNIKRRYRSADGIELVADVAGPADAPAVVLLHGGGQTRHSWSGAMRDLAGRGYHVISYDARGHGESDWSPTADYALDDRVNDLRAIVETLAQPYALVGASLGGATAIHAAASGLSPAAMILVDIVPEPEHDGIARIVDFMRANPAGFASLDEAADAVAAYNPARPRPRDPSGLLRNLRARDDGRLYWHWDPLTTATPAATHHAVVQRSARALAQRSKMPLMLVRGLKSEVVSDSGVAAFKADVPWLEVADVRDAGHMVAGDRNDAFSASVAAFLLRHLTVEMPA
ncbi:MAG: alpha/beta hydrolase [Candidatus Sphingomonas colombiensis]|nr:alpha/beta hydrolase [Sphingomonas sp.]WEK43870.1 MAG: alpha/beta hydrolase [Sphingomonas sp.]